MSLKIDYQKYKYDIKKYPFKDMLQNLYDSKHLEKLHKEKAHLLPKTSLNFDNEASTDFHKIFYKKLNSDWPQFINTYEKFIKNEVVKVIKKPFLYQYLPSYRVHLPNDQAIHKWHYDSDQDHKHPDGEINFCIAITQMRDTTAIWCETEPAKKDYFPMEIDYGEFFKFNGNKCTHGNKKNNTDNVRISMDFRILPLDKYNENKANLSVTSKKKFIIGEYYKLLD